MSLYEYTDVVVVSLKISPPKYFGDQPDPPGISPAELADDSDCLVFCQEPVLGHETGSTEVNFSGGKGVKVVDPIRVGAPPGANDDLAGTWIVGENHCDGLVKPPGLASGVDEQQERPIEHPAPAAPVEKKCNPELGEREPTRRLPQAEQRSSSTRPFGRREGLRCHRN
jgi:hypothetical protein